MKGTMEAEHERPKGTKKYRGTYGDKEEQKKMDCKGQTNGTNERALVKTN